MDPYASENVNGSGGNNVGQGGSDSPPPSQEQQGGVPTTEEVYDPERAERIRQMMEQANNPGSVMEDDQVTDFVMRMQEKNQNMVDSVRELQHRERGQQQQQQTQPEDIDPQYTISDDSDESDMGQRSDLDASFNRRQRQSRRNRNHRSSPDDYPPGEAYAGDEMDEEDQIPSYDPKDDDAVSYGRLCCVACALVIAMIATSVLILVFVIVADQEESAAHHHHDHGFDGMVLPFAPSNLQQLCSMSALKTFQGVLDCREPCMKAACCWERGENGQQPVCWESHPLECAPYESCINLLSAGSNNGGGADGYPETGSMNHRPTSNIPVAPDGVKSCNPNNINSVDEVLLCEDSCSYGACCWKKDSGNHCPTDPNCDGYKPCDILNSGSGGGSSGGTTPAPAPTAPGTIIPAAVNLAQACKFENKDDCQFYCNKAPCCWKLATVTYTGPLGATVTESVMGSCSHEAACVGYAPCRDLPTAIGASSATTEIPIPQVSGLQEACDKGIEGVCRETCNAATCCWQIAINTFTNESGQQITEAVQGTCNHRPECAEYKPCLKLPESDGQSVATTAPASVPQPIDLAQVCATSLDGLCRETCHKATCCWKLATTTYTGPQGNQITESVMGSCSHLDECGNYAPCKQLSEASASHTHAIPAAPADLSSTCAASFDGQCRDTCHQATCCWKIATTQYTGPLGAHVTEHVKGSCSHRPECVGYEPCQKLPEASAESSAVTPPPLYVPVAPANLDQVCHPEPEEMDSIEACVEYCDAAMCCWKMSTTSFTNAEGSTVTESVQGSCSHQPECAAYKACSVLDNDVFSPHTTPAPVPSTSGGGGGGPAPANPPAPQPTDAPAAPADDPTSNTEYTEEVIFDVCYNHEQQGSGPNLCEQVCTPGACCWKPGEGACSSSIDCGKYEPCTKLIQNSSNGNQPTELEQACADRSDLAECVRLCADATCCFTTNLDKTCDVTKPGTVCSEFTPCEIIYNGGN